MTDRSDTNTEPTLREYFRVTPSTGSETTADIDAHLTSLTDLRKSLSDAESSSGILGGLSGDSEGEKVKFSYLAVSTGPDEPVELYYTADGKLETLGRRLHAIYPESFDIEKVHLDIGNKLIKPVRMSKDEFTARLLSDQLYVSPEEICTELDWGGELDEGKAVEVRDPTKELPLKGEVDTTVVSPGTNEDPETGDGGTPEPLSDSGDINQPDSPVDKDIAGPSTATTRSETADSDATDAEETANSSGGDENTNDVRFAFGAENTPSEENNDTDDETEDSNNTTAKASVPGDGGKVPIDIVNDEAVGTALVDPPSKAVPNIIETGDDDEKNQLADVTLDRPTLAPNQEDIFARPALEYTHPRATRWYGQEETIKDWMTTLNTATESNPEYESESQDETNIESPETAETLFEHLEKAETPVGFQVVFQARRDWSDQAQRRKRNIRSGDFDEPWLEKYVLGGYETDEDRDLKAYEYRRIKLIENKRPKKTFNVNVRALSLPPSDEFEDDTENPSTPKTGDLASAEEDVGALKPLFDPLDGVYYHVVGETPPQGGATGTDLTASEVAQNFLHHSLITREDRRGMLTRFNLWNDPKKRPELILNAEELSDFIVIPSGEEMDSDAFRSTGTTDADADHLRRPRPQIYNQLTDGMDIGYAFDEDGFPEDRPTSIPEGVLTNHWAKFGASGAGKSINTNGILLSLYRNIGGLTVFVDPKAGDMVENYAKSHAATFGDLKDVRVFNVPEVLPAIPFFDIRPYLYEGMNRDDAIQQKVDEFHLVMEMVDDNYSTAYVAKTVLGALIKSQFDARHGEDSFTLDDLYDAAVEMYADQTIPRVSHQPQVKRILSNQLNNSEQDFKNTMQAVINRLDDLQEDINLYRLFNQNPEWDEETGTYKTNRKTREQYEEELENTDSDDPNPEPPRSALDFRELLDTDKVILFDTGSFVRDESQQAFSMYILSALWGAVRSRYNDRKSHEDIETTVNLVIEEAAPIVSTELVTNTLIPEAREFGLSIGMVMQFPEQVRKHSDSDTYNELITNVQSKIIGQLEPDDRIAESLAYGDRDKQEIKNKIAQLSGGEWIADLPAPAFGVDVPQPFSIRSLDIPEGHPEGEAPFNETEREVFYKRYESRKNRVANKFGYRQPSAEEVAKQQSVGDSVGFSDAKEDDSEDSQESTPSPRVPATGGDTSVENDAGPESGGHGIVGSESDEEVNLGATADDEPSPAANSATNSEPAGDSEASLKDDEQTADTEAGAASIDPDSDTPDFGAYAPLPRDAIEDVCGEIAIDGRPDLANIAGELLTSLPEQEYYGSLLSLSQIAAMEGIEIKPVELHKSANRQASGDGVDAEATKRVNAPTGEATPHASDAEETDSGGDDSGSTASDTGAVDSSSGDEGGDSGTPESDDGGNSNPTPQRTGGNSSEDAPENDDIPFEDSTNTMFAGNDTDDDEQQTTDGEDSQQTADSETDSQAADNKNPFALKPTEDEAEELSRIDLTDDDDEQTAEDNTDSEDPTDVSLTTPLPEAYADFNLDRHDDHEFSADDKEFMALIASAFRDELDWYSLEESMTDVRDRAGEPDVDSLIECGYVDETTVQRKKYYSLTRKGWRVVGDSVPGNEFGDHMEKMQHRVGVHFLAEYIADRDDVAWAEPYAQYEGETYDVVGYDGIGTVLVTGEVETESNNPAAVAEDYEKLSDAPGDVIWAHPAERDFSAIWKMINQRVLDEELSVTTIDRTSNLREYLEDNELSGVDDVKTYGHLTDSE